MPKLSLENFKKSERLKSSGGQFVDASGNVIFLHGVNLSGSAKVPINPDGTTHYDQALNFKNHRNASFVGRPLPEDTAGEHLDRLKKWGFNFLRFLVTWEGVEHKGPGNYDEDYLDYLVRMVELAGKKGFYLFIDPHQDVWSRFTGGDGAPGWTLEEVGMNIEKLREADLTIVHHEKGKSYRRMSWPLNYQKYPTATLFALFFGGRHFAPRTLIRGKNAQDFLQSHFIKSMVEIAKRVKKYNNVIGFDCFNEPSPGWIGKSNLGKFDGFGFGPVECSSPFQEMYMSEGISAQVSKQFLFGFHGVPMGKVSMNPNQITIWKNGFHCPWQTHNIWDLDPNGAPMLLKPDYFQSVSGKKIHFFKDFMKPFIHSFKKEIQKVEKTFFIFMESDPSKLELEWKETENKGQSGVVNATHWYNASLLFTKRFLDWFGIHSFKHRLVFGKEKITDMHRESIAMIRDMSKTEMENCPTVIGETGIPMDLNSRIGYTKSDYKLHEEAMNLILSAMETNLVNYTIWNYTPDNTQALGDRWNEEDLSIYSKDTPSEVCPDGGRGTKAFARPYPMITRGIPEILSFDYHKSLFKYTFRRKGKEKPECLIFLPPVHYPGHVKVLLNAGNYEYDPKSSLLYFSGPADVDHFGITILPEK